MLASQDSDKSQGGQKSGQSNSAAYKREEDFLQAQAQEVGAQIRSLEAQLRSLRSQQQEIQEKLSSIQNRQRGTWESAGKGKGQQVRHHLGGRAQRACSASQPTSPRFACLPYS